ncbi:hypothetical protein J3R82DRAFT_6630 [Butyriboletus roseoflavus]|nr:hypothetical protein J3R82DRAFT_6630 [Butyriboletus roseoflavus]
MSNGSNICQRYSFDFRRPSYDCSKFNIQFRYLSPYELIPGATLGYTFCTITITPSLYLLYLLSCYLENGGGVLQATVEHINQVLEEGIAPFVRDPVGATCNIGTSTLKFDAIFVCTGLGSRFLGGVEDHCVYPLRGETVLLRAPWVCFGRSFEGKDGTYTYVMSRENGDVLIGGTKTPNDWSATPRPDTTTDILTRAFALVPELAPPNVSSPTVDDLRPLVIEVGCGLRPAREGGIRLEVERVASPDQQGKMVAVVFNYGHAGYGYISSWGSASVAVGLLEEAMNEAMETLHRKG